MNMCRVVRSAIFYGSLTLNLGAIDPAPQRWITIFVHGTIGLRPNLALNTFIKVMQDKLDESPYKIAVDCIRDDNFFYLNQPIQLRGLHKIDLTNHQEYLGAHTFARLFDDVQQHVNPAKIINDYYTFGWSGLISHKIRFEEARTLYAELSALIASYQEQNIPVKIRIIAYSHGGNLALNLGAIRDDKQHQDTFIIDELILIGTPVQKETDYLVCSPVFSHVYNIYSRGDMVQCLDCFSFHRFFSNRRFKTNRRYCLPNNLTQIEIKVKMSKTTTQHDCHWSLCNKKQARIDRSPGHVELWFFGWPRGPNTLYRPHFPLFPIPIALFIPAITSQVHQYAPHKQSLILEWRLHEGTIALRPRHHQRKLIVDFLPTPFVKDLQTKALAAEPSNYTAATHKAHVKNILRRLENRKSAYMTTRTKTLCAS